MVFHAMSFAKQSKQQIFYLNLLDAGNKNMKKLLQYLKPYSGRMIVGFVIKLIGTIVELFLPWILSHMIDNVIPRRQVNLLVLWGLLMLVCSFIAVSFNIMANRMASRVARNTTEQIRNDLFSKIMYLSNKQVDSITIPSLISRITTDTYNVHQMLGMMQRLGVRAPIMLIGGIIITFTLDVKLTFVMLSVMPVILVLVIFVSRIGIPMYSILQRKIDQLVRVVREDADGIRVIKALSKESYEKEKFAKINQEAAEQEKKANMIMSALNPGMNLCLNLGTVFVIVAGAYQVNHGELQAGVIIAFLTYVTLILNALLFASKMFMIYSKASASAKRIVDIMDLPEELQVEQMEKKESQYHIEFDHVTFSYHNKKNMQEQTLNDIHFFLKKGETLGIIGATGSGKSTIVQLLMRFYDVQKGAIRIDGRDIRSIETEKLRKKFGVVFQNDFISADSIYENIRFGREIYEDEIMEAATIAKANEFILGKSEGFETVIAAKGADLSGGQKQRLLISRAVAAKPEILILDDSSSALDYKTDAALRKELREQFQETTIILIAQRVSSVMQANHICVLDEGNMIGYGTHKELIKTCSVYQEISQLQLGEERR